MTGGGRGEREESSSVAFSGDKGEAILVDWTPHKPRGGGSNLS